jgi:arylsulfatase A-like enzyme
MNKIRLSLLLLCCIFGYFSSGAQELPNIILIVADDLGYGDLGFQGSKQIPTPNIDKLAKEGVVFTNGYVSSSVCSPSRAGLMTGKNQLRFGYFDNTGPNQTGFDPDYKGLPLTETTVADELKSLGYITGLMGKWHLGEAPHFYPLKRGFDEFWGFLGGGHDYVTANPDGQDMVSPIECSYKSPEPLTYMTDDCGNESVDFIKRHKNEPFFLFSSFNAPHSPMQATEADLELFKHIKDDLRRTYCAMVYRLDVNVGKIIKTLEDEGIKDNTLVVFISDNGGPADLIANGSINAPLNGQKTTLLEGGVRVPYIMNWPKKLTAGKVVNTPVSSLDFYPTFVTMAGGKIDKQDDLDGVNILPFLAGETEEIPHESMKWRYTVGAAIREGDWKLIRLPDRLPMLYNLSEDISEQNDVALENLDLTRDLLKKLGKWDVYLPHPVFHEPAGWRRRHLGFYDVEYQLTQPQP